MTEVCKLLFDLSLWFTLSGFYLRLAAGVGPSLWGFLALSAAVCLDALVRRRALPARRAGFLRLLPLFPPLLSFLAPLTLWQALQLLPVWGYLGWSFRTDRVAISYDGFRSHFSFCLKLLLLLIFGPLFPGRFGGALLASVPYLVAMLAFGVCLLRSLREQKPSGLRQGVYIALFLLVCAGLTLGKAPQLLLQAAGMIWQYALAPLIFAAAIVFAGVFYGVYLLLRWLVERAQGSGEPFSPDIQGAAEAIGMGEEYAAVKANAAWLRVLLIILAVCLLLFLLYRMFRRMLGDPARDAKANPWTARDGLRSPASPQLRRGFQALLRPKDPRLAIRYDFARFLAECRRRGFSPPKSMTAAELASHSAERFPGADPAALAALYTPARYSARERVTSEDARRCAVLLRELKHSVSPTDSESRKKTRKRA